MCFINILYNALSICILIFITNNLKKINALAVGGGILGKSKPVLFLRGISKTNNCRNVFIYFVFSIYDNILKIFNS